MNPHNPYGPPPGQPPGGYPYGGAPAAGGMSGSPLGAQYEFNEAENRVVTRTGTFAIVLGCVRIVLGLASVLSCNPCSIVFNLAYEGTVGGLFINSGLKLGQIAKTQGQDVTHMMSALNSIYIAILVRIIVMILAFLVYLGLIAIALLALGASALR